MGMFMSVPLIWQPNGGHVSLVEYRVHKFNYLCVNLTGHKKDSCVKHDKTLVKETKCFFHGKILCGPVSKDSTERCQLSAN